MSIVLGTKRVAKNDNTEELKGCSRSPIPTALYLLQQRVCLGFNVIIAITPCEYSHDIPSNPFVAIKNSTTIASCRQSWCWTKIEWLGFFVIHFPIHCKNRQLSKSSQVKLTFIGCSGPNCSAFYLYMATRVGLSATLSYAHVQAWEVWLMCGNVRTLHYVSVFDFLKVNVCTSITGSSSLDAIIIRYIQYSITIILFYKLTSSYCQMLSSWMNQ